MFKQLTVKMAAVFTVFAMTMFSAFAQNKSISGTVVDGSGVPVIGASVFVVGNTSNGAITDLDGRFSLNVPENSSITISCIGYSTQTLPVGNQSVFNVVLLEDSEFLEETVVIGYGVQKKSDLTGSVASVNEKALRNQSTTDAGAALQGKVSGVNIISNASPGEAATIRVRGYSSNSSNISPLLIVDGLQVDNISYLDPSMIESMEVLKDAASAAIYGAEAGNGVVLITTKSGSAGSASVTYAYKATYQTFNRRIMLDRDGFLEWMNMKQGTESVSNMLNMYDYSHSMYDGGVIDTDWMDAYLEGSWSQQHSISFSGGNNQGHFFASLNSVKNDGIVVGDKDVYKRLSAQVNVDYTLFKWLQVGSNNSIEKWSTKSVSQRGYGSSFESMLLMDPLTPVYWTTPDEFATTYRSMYNDVQNGTASVTYRFLGDENGWYANSKYSDAEGSALAKRDATDASSSGFNIRGTLFANLTPIDGLTITSRLGYRIADSSSHSYTAPYYVGTRGSVESYTISAATNRSWYYQWENFANYMRDFGKHSFTAMVGMSYRESHSDNTSVSSTGSDILTSYEDNFLYIDYLTGDATKTVSNAPSKTASLAYFGRLIYSYDNRYSIQANFRADAFDSSKLNVDNRWGYFPSVSAGWTISNEPFFKDNVNGNIFNFLKLRASWGRNGNISVLSGYLYDSTISIGNSWYQYSVDEQGSVYSSSPSSLANPNLKWETSEQWDFGLDARFLNNRLTLGIDYFDKTTKDLIFSKASPPELGFDSVTVNGGNVQNNGLEIELSWRDSIGDFDYEVGGNFSWLHNEVKSLPGSAPRVTASDASSSNYQILTAFEPGYSVWYLRGYKYTGVDSNGDATFEDLNGDGTIDSSDMTYIGQTTPKYTFGLNINLAYKGFDLAISGSGIAGNSIMPVLHRTGYYNTMEIYLDKVKDGTYPNASNIAGDFKFWSSDANVFKGNYFRIKQLQLGYTLPSAITMKAKIKEMRVYVSLDDFITFTSYPGLDPETASTNSTSGAGLDWGSYPTSQKVLLGVNITF